jgi:hypothetical protein
MFSLNITDQASDFQNILWRIDPLLRGDSVNNSRCYGVPSAYASHNNRRGDADGVFCRSVPRLYDSTDRVLLSERVQCSAVGGSRVECYTADHGSGIIFIAKIRYQETSSEDTAEERPFR